MRAWIAGVPPGRDTLRLGDCPRPEAAPGKLLVCVRYAGLNFSDGLMIDDAYQIKPPRPFVPGQEIAGIVEQAPEGSRFLPGDRLVAKVDWGAFAEFALVREDMAIRVPDDLDLLPALALPVVYTTSMVALTACCTLKPGDIVLVHAAAGGVGLAAVEIAKARGAIVIATAGSAEKLALAQRHGADHLVNYAESDFVDAVKTITHGRGADVIFDPVGGDIGEASLKALARDATLLIVGFASGRIPKLAANRLLLKRASAKGVYWSHDQDAALLARIGGDLVAMLRSGAIRPQVAADYALADLPRALADLESRRSSGKLALDISRKP